MIRSKQLTPAVIAIAVVLIAGASKLAEPLGGDQSLFLIGAHAMHDHALLYRDFWDLKQPGIYAFYFLATSIGSYSGEAIHAFELAYMLVFAFTLILGLRGSRNFTQAATITPIAAVGFPYIASGSFEAIQVESLVALPLFVVLWSFVSGAGRPTERERFLYFLVGGLFGAIVLAFKLIFLPIIAVFWLVTIGYEALHHRSDGRTIAIFAMGAALGIAIPSAAIVGFFAIHGVLEEALRTWFVLPPRIVRSVPHESVSILFGGIRWFVHRFYGMGLLAVVGVSFAIRRKPDTMLLGLVAWIVMGTAIILIQVTSWFQYQWLLIAAPLGVLATLGFRDLCHMALGSQNASAARIAAVLGISIAAIEPSSLAIHDARNLTANRFAIDAVSRERYRDSVSPVYAALSVDARFVEPIGTLYVLGDPTFYVLTNRLQPVVLNGSSVRLFLPEQWNELERELRAARPKYLYVSRAVVVSSSALAHWIETTYRLRHHGTLGSLYVDTHH